ncbi:hypothetical protein HZI73_09845 [Vallitalea pronyensis]|uniref:Uncharacterized protein n=1 Tax=Vallitalea pronyensis TaxID=1348613 RepID=A0A8J8MJ36_9FIRM|nr:hypothetical protein [Vallitalea pronyensis]QUI22584.1 hypothetical protein HZI73_09845 [Vallitalea pronyensis]
MSRTTPKGHLVETYMLDHTKVKIYDSAYINRTSKEIERTLQIIKDMAISHYQGEVRLKRD